MYIFFFLKTLFWGSISRCPGRTWTHYVAKAALNWSFQVYRFYMVLGGKQGKHSTNRPTPLLLRFIYKLIYESKKLGILMKYPMWYFNICLHCIESSILLNILIFSNMYHSFVVKIIKSVFLLPFPLSITQSLSTVRHSRISTPLCSSVLLPCFLTIIP